MTTLIFIINPAKHKDDISSKCGMMYLNRLCIDEDAAFELSEVFTWNQTTEEIANCIWPLKNTDDEIDFSEAKGKESPFLLRQ